MKHFGRYAVSARSGVRKHKIKIATKGSVIAIILLRVIGFMATPIDKFA